MVMKKYRNNLTRRTFFSGLFIFLSSVTAVSQDIVAFKKTSLVIDTPKGPKKFSVELAVNEKQHSQGLMYRRILAPNAGMLFDYRYLRRISMWMKNTYIPLDMLFLNQNGKITHIVQRTIPHSLSTISSKGLVRAVLEVNSGTVSKLGIEIGDTVRHSIFGNVN